MKLKEDKKAKSKSFFFSKNYEIFDQKYEKFLINYFLKTKKDIRICMHNNKRDLHHDMIILQQKGNFYKPHKHKKKGETYHVIKGSMFCILFNENGKIVNYKHVKKNNILRTPINIHHTIVPFSKFVIYHEGKTGPLEKKNDSIFPSWANNSKIQKNIELLIKKYKIKKNS